MPRTEIIKNSFVGGEISPRMLARTDMAKYHAACESIQNFVVEIQGGVNRRAGLRYVIDASGPHRLIPFKISIDQQYILEFGNGNITFYVNGGQIQSSPGVPYRIFTPYNLGDLWEIHYAQEISTMYLCNPNYPPQKLIRITDTNWQLVQPNFYAPPCVKQDQDVGTDKGASIAFSPGTITASAPVFINGDIGKAVVAGTGIGYITSLAGTTTTDPVTGAVLYPTAQITLADPFDTNSYAVGQWFLRGGPNAYFSPGTYDSTNQLWHGAHKIGFGKPVNVWATRDHPSDASYQTVVGGAYQDVTYTGGFIDAFRAIDNGSYVPFSGGYGHITSIISSQQVSTTVLSIPTVIENDAYGNPLTSPSPPGSWYYETPAFVPGNYPHAVCFYGDRLYLAGTEGSTPNTVWGSGVGDYENFALGTLDSSAIRFTINSSSFDHIHWMTPYQGSIVMGGTTNEYVVNGGAGQAVISAGAPITPNNINVITQSNFGVAEIQGIVVDNDLLFIQKTKQKTYRFAYNAVTSSYGSNNLNVMNEIITTAGFKEMIFVHQPTKVVWFTDLGGNLVGLTYDKEQDVWAWHRQFTGQDGPGDQFVSIATIDTQDGTLNQVWALCRRTRSGVFVYTIEIMDDSLNTDCASTVVPDPSQPPISSISGLQYLQGRPVQVIADGVILPTTTMDSGGNYFFPPGFTAANLVEAGLGYTSTLLTVRPEPRSTVQGLIKRWLRIWARVVNTVHLIINDQVIPVRTPQVPIGQIVPPITGDVQINNLGYDRDGRVAITQNAPMAAHVLGIFGVVELGDV